MADDSKPNGISAAPSAAKTPEVTIDKDAVLLVKLQALFDAKIAKAHEFASIQGGFRRIVLTKEDLEVLK